MHQHGRGWQREKKPAGTGLPAPAPHQQPPEAAVHRLQGLAGNAAVARTVARGSWTGTGTPVQRSLVVGRIDYTMRYQRKTRNLPEEKHSTAVDELSHEVLSHLAETVDKDLSPEERQQFMNHHSRIIDQLRKAIVAPVGHKGYHPALKREIGAHPDFGAKNHKILVNDYTELARHLMGWVAAKGNRRKEKEIAQKIQAEGDVEAFLNVLLKRLYRRFEDEKNERLGKQKFTDDAAQGMARELTTGLSDPKLQPVLRDARGETAPPPRPIGTYGGYFGAEKFEGSHLRPGMLDNGGYLAVLRTPEKFGFRDKVITLHDLQEYYAAPNPHTPRTRGSGWLPGNTEEELRSTAGFDADGKRLPTQDRGSTNLRVSPPNTGRRQPSVRNENSETTKLARSKNLPVWAGQSRRAARMLKLAKTAGASQEEIAAVAWGVFSFWRLHYDHTAELAYHTLHEVMDIAQNFGVPYDMDRAHEGGTVPTGQRLRQRLVGLADEVTAAHDEADAEIEAIESGTDQANRQGLREFLIVAKRAREQLAALRLVLQERIDAFEGWEEGTLTTNDKSRLVEQSLRSLDVVKSHLVMLSGWMAMWRPKEAAEGSGRERRGSPGTSAG
ncbi:hypothetical protein [Streptomyces sp. NPDC017260]|uniref:hypothetical protein n=1 Tax=unclassified Streptomyces TaxID=2593676 RepID=UPI0037A66D45